MTTKLTEDEIQELLVGPERDLHLVQIVQQWHQLNDNQKREIVKIMTQYVLSYQAEALLSKEKVIDGD
jgi:hypothetical protein